MLFDRAFDFERIKLLNVAQENIHVQPKDPYPHYQMSNNISDKEVDYEYDSDDDEYTNPSLQRSGVFLEPNSKFVL